ncbi:MAG TPA: hypothetical protein VMM56_13080 [Planctomycetaceae bacterium]|nr:hypothetical protein [Planctomycetaceae bacterium]
MLISRTRLFLLLAVSLLCRTGLAEEKSTESDKKSEDTPRFIRVITNPDNGQLVSMDTAIARYQLKREGKETVVVDLIGAVHIGEKDYYDKLEKLFKQYDALLYELVAPKGTTIPKGGKRETENPLSALQKFMKDALRLEFQLEQIDYQAKNFVHADMSPDEFAKSMKRLNESPLTMFLQLMRASMAQQAERKSQVSDALLLAALFDRKNGPVVLKRALAQELGSSDIMLDALNGPNGSTILTERNKVALEVMREQIKAGKTKIGIFYGAAHPKDMHERLIEKDKMTLEELTWLKAWDLHIDLPEKAKTEEESKASSN